MSARGRVLSVGSSGPVLASLSDEPRPDYVLFVVSLGELGSKSVLEYEILPALPPDYSPHYHQLEISQPDNIRETFRETGGQIREWMSKHGLGMRDVDVDFTGGTKVMSVVLGLVAVEEGVDTVYVSGERSGGTVISGTEEVVHLPNPYKEFAVRELNEAQGLLNKYHADAASEILRSGSESCAEIYRGTLNAYYRLANSLKLADLFEFNDKNRDRIRGALFEFRASRFRINSLLSAPLNIRLESLYAHWEKVAADTSRSNETAGRHTLLELLANAERRADQARYDDAIARLYRAVELRGQQLLKKAFGGELGRVPLRGLSENETSKFRSLDINARGGVYEIRGVARLYETLRLSSEEDISAAAGRYDFLKAHMQNRNESLLAHGLSPVDKDLFTSFWRSALLVLEVDDSEIPRWPEFRLPLE